MKNIVTQILFTSGLILSIFARPHGFDDEGEISVPRSPKIQGPVEVTLSLKKLTQQKFLQCQLEGTPTPSVVWLKDGQETTNGKESPYKTDFDAKDGTTSLHFQDTAYTNEKYMTGNFTCVAANFLGRVQKIFFVTAAHGNDSNNEDDVSTDQKEKIADAEGDTTPLNLAIANNTILSHPVPVLKGNDSKSANNTDAGPDELTTIATALLSMPNSTTSSSEAKMEKDSTTVSSGNADLPVESR